MSAERRVAKQVRNGVHPMDLRPRVSIAVSDDVDVEVTRVGAVVVSVPSRDELLRRLMEAPGR